MKRLTTILLFLSLLCGLNAAPFFIRINGAGDHPVSLIADKDHQGREQYVSEPIAINNGDFVTIFDQSSGAEWTISVIDPYGAHASFTTTGNQVKCTKSGCYTIYLKMKWQDDMLYIEDATGCDNNQDNNDNTGGDNTGGDNTGNDNTDDNIDTPDSPDGEYTPGNYASAVPSQAEDVMIQAFYWDSYDAASTTKSKYGNTKWTTLNEQAGELAAYFDLVWLAPSAKSSGGTGYHPSQWCNQNSDHGSRPQLETLIKNLHAGGAKVIADIVINHRDNKSSWCDFHPEDFGQFGAFQLTAEHICKDDEVNSSSTAGACKGAATGAYDTGEKYGAARDLDHENSYVRNAVKAYLKWMKHEMKFDGWRFDVAKGFKAAHFGEYAKDAKQYLSVGEYLDGNYDLVNNWVNGTGKQSMAFDFPLKFNGLNDGLKGGDLTKLVWSNQPAGLIHNDMRRYAVTFVGNHDTFERGNGNDFASIGQKDLILQANAFILSSPGIPCVFFPHWAKYKEDIKPMILARKAVGIHSQSAVSVTESGRDKYVATVTGKNGSLIIKLGSGSNAASTPSGYTKAAAGNNWAIYIKTNTAPAPKLVVSPAGGRYIGGVTVTLSALNADKIYYTLDGTQPTTASLLYTAPVEIKTNTTLKAMAVGAGGQSAVQTHEYETEHNGEPITVRFRKPADWEAVYLWAWDNNGNLFPGGASAKWPGAAITDEGNGWWSHTFDAAIYEVNLVFNEGKASGGKQTNDLYTDKSICYAMSDMEIAVETDCNATGLRDTHIESIAVYPNPAHHTLHVQGVDNVKAMDVYSATGQKMTSVHNSAMLNVSGWSKGIYFLIIKTDNTVHNARFIKE